MPRHSARKPLDGARFARRALALLAAVTLVAIVPTAAAAQADGPDVSVRAVAQKAVVRPGDQLAIAVVIEHGAGFHTWPNQAQLVVPPEFGPDFPAIVTEIEVLDRPGGAQVGAVQWPTPSTVTVYYTGAPLELLSFHDTAVAYVPVTMPAERATGEATFSIRVGFQSCDDTNCYFPEETVLRVPLEVAPAGSAAGAPAEPELFAAFDPAAGFADAADSGTSPACRVTDETLTINFFGWAFTFHPCGASGLTLLLLVAALGGVLLNFTPCVLPVIPLKVMGLSRAAGTPGRLLTLGVAMFLGVVAFWLTIGGAIAFISGFDAISSLFQTDWFSLVVGLIVAVMALGMLGLFTTSLPQSVYRFNPNQESVQGSFLFGVLTAVLSTPCTAPFMGGASAWAATQSATVTLSTFAAIGVGMAVPYLALAARPGLVHRVPRSGPGSEAVKQVMGLLMLAVAVFFLGIPIAGALQDPPDPASRAYWYVVVALVVLACAWLAYRTYRLVSEPRRRLAVMVPAVLFALALAYLAPGLASHGPIDWTYYTPERFAEEQAAGRVVVLDFTAEWCLNCKALESGVLHQPDIVELLSDDGVVPMRVDLTGDNPVGKAKLKELQWVGIPLLAVFGPGIGYDAPLMYDAYTQEMLREALAAARGGQVGLAR